MRIFMINVLMVLGMFAATSSALADEANDWTKNFWAWGRGYSTSQAAQDACNQAQPQIKDLKAECEGTKGVMAMSSEYGYCTTDNDPMFCPSGCYICPIYGKAKCTHPLILKVGDLVEAKVDADLYSGSSVVGHVAKGDKFKVADIQGDWISLEKIDGTAVRGWVQSTNLKLSAQ